MNNLVQNFFDSNIFLALSQALIHSVWQGVMVFIGVYLMFQVRKTTSAQQRYNAALTGLFIMFAFFIGTFAYYLQSLNTANLSIYYGDFSVNPASYNVLLTDLGTFEYKLNSIIPILWIFGFSILIIKTLGSHLYLRWLKLNSTSVVSPKIIELKESLSKKLGITSKIQIMESKHVTSPFTMGFFKPLILFPIGMLNKLNVEDVEAILAHEFAHILRKDYLINLTTTFIETCLYYHPVVWWLSKIVKTERELLCDEMAISHTQNPLQYAKLLVSLQENYFDNKLAMSINNNQSFTNRIKTILNMNTQTSLIKDKTLMLLLLIGIGLFAFRTQLKAWTDMSSINEDPITIEMIDEAPSSEYPFDSEEMLSDTLPSKYQRESNMHMSRSTDEGSFEVMVENGVITEMKVDGEVISEEDYHKYEDRMGDRPVAPMPPNPPNVWHFDGNWDGDMRDYDSLINGSMRVFKMDMDEFKDNMKDFKMNFDFDFGDMPHPPAPPSPPRPGAPPAPPHPGHFNFNYDFGNLEDIFDSTMVFNFNGWEDGINIKEMIEDAMRQGRIHQEGINLEELEMGSEELQELQERLSEQMQHLGNGFNFSFGEKGKDFRYPPRNRGSNLEQLLGQQLNKDGFLLPGVENKVQLTNKTLKINGDKMPDVIHNKYKQLFETETGIPLNKDTKIQFNMLGKKTGSRSYRAF